jgi:hypothetical protein
VDLDRFAELFETFERCAFRYESRAEYRVDEEADDYARFVRGEPLPSMDAMDSWLDRLRRQAAEGKINERVRRLPPAITPYIRFEVEWAYVYNADAGEKIYVIADTTLPPLPSCATDDFWLFDDARAVQMHYDDDGVWLGFAEAETAEVPEFVRAAALLRERSRPLSAFLAEQRNR